METLIDIFALLAGGLGLYFGAELLVKGSAGLAHALGVKPLIIGLTVVAYGTSAPELAVSTSAILDGASPIVLGNVVGSCVANLGLILGITALISPPAVDGQLIRREIPVLCLSVALTPLMLFSGIGIVSLEAAILLACAFAFTFFTLFGSDDGTEIPEEVQEVLPEEQSSKLRLGVITLIGLTLLVFCGDLFVSGAQGIALTLGMSERLVGLTVVAIGTSLPELAASLVAAARGYSSMAVGNVVGSNIFNIFLIFGVVGLIRPIHANEDSSRLTIDLGFLVGVTVIGVLFMRGSRKISRLEGALLTTCYVSFMIIAVVIG